MSTQQLFSTASTILATQRKLLEPADAIGAVREGASATRLAESSSSSTTAPKRADDQFRKILVKCRVLEGAVGSSYVEIGDTKVVCSVNGPKEQSNADSQEGTLNVTVSGIESCARHTILSALNSIVCLKKIVRAEVDVELSVLADDGGALAAALMAANVALISANVECFDILLACHFLLFDDGRCVLDPDTRRLTAERAGVARRLAAARRVDSAEKKKSASKEGGDDGRVGSEAMDATSSSTAAAPIDVEIMEDEEDGPRSVADVTVAIAPSLGQVVFADACRGSIRKEVLAKAIRFGFDKCLEIYPIISKNLHNYASKSL